MNERNADVSKTLTEKWKNGELPSGWYYVRLIRGEYRIDLYINSKNEWIDCPDNIIDTVVCEVPSFEEYQKLLSDQLAKNEDAEINAELEERLKKTQKLELDLRRENRKLRQLLKLNNVLNKGSKSIYAWLKEDTAGEQKKLCADMFDKTVEMMSEINQVLGEE